MGIAFAIAVVLAATQGLETPVIAVELASESDTLDEGLTLDMIVDALQRRVLGAPVAVLAGDVGVTRVWAVHIVRRGDQALVQIEDPTGAILFAQALRSRNVQPRSLAHTIALLVVEVLSERVPDLLRIVPPTPPTDVSPAPTEAQDAPTPPPRPRDFWLATGAAGAYLLPKGWQPWGVELEARAVRRLFAASLELAWWAPVRTRGEDYSVRADMLSALLGAGLSAEAGPAALRLTLGPALRSVKLSTRGVGMAFAQRRFLDIGVGLRLAAETRRTGLRLGIAAVAERMLAHERVWVDGTPVLNLGPTMMHLTLYAILPM